MASDSGAQLLEFEEDTSAQRGEWRFERAGWLLIAVLVACGLAGLFGDGWLSRASVASADGRATLRYDRLARFGATTALSLTLPPGAASDSLATVSMSRAYLERVAIQQVVPEPVETRSSDKLVEFRFRRTAAGQPIRIDVVVAHTASGVSRVTVGTESGALAVRQFVFP